MVGNFARLGLGLLGSGGGAPSAPVTPVTITYIAGTSSTADASTYTFTAQSLGDAADIVVAIGTRGSVTNGTISSVTVHTPDEATDPTGTALSEVVARVNSTTGFNTSAIYSVARPSGQSTGDIKITFAAAKLRCRIDVYKKTAHSSVVTGSSASNPPSVTLNVPASGCAIGAAVSTGGTTSTPTNLTEDADVQIEAATTFTAASSNVASGNTTMTFTFVAATNPVGAFAAFGP